MGFYARDYTGNTNSRRILGLYFFFTIKWVKTGVRTGVSGSKDQQCWGVKVGGINKKMMEYLQLICHARLLLGLYGGTCDKRKLKLT